MRNTPTVTTAYDICTRSTTLLLIISASRSRGLLYVLLVVQTTYAYIHTRSGGGTATTYR